MSDYTRQEHIAWLKKRAIEFAKANDLANALNSMNSDLQKHPQTKGHLAAEVGTQLYMSGNLTTPEEMIKFIQSIN